MYIKYTLSYPLRSLKKYLSCALNSTINRTITWVTMLSKSIFNVIFLLPDVPIVSVSSIKGFKMSGKPPAGDRGGVLSSSGSFVKPNVPPPQQNKKRRNDMDNLGTISENSRKYNSWYLIFIYNLSLYSITLYCKLHWYPMFSCPLGLKTLGTFDIKYCLIPY